MFGSCLFFFVLAILYEVLKFYRQMHLNATNCRMCGISIINNRLRENSSDDTANNGESMPSPSHPLRTSTVVVNPRQTILSAVHLIQTLFHVVQVFLSYLLMLGFMLFNIWICISILLGTGIGYFSVGWRTKPKITGTADHCNT